MSEREPFELEPSTSFTPERDERPRVPEPLPVRIVAVSDVCLPAQAGLEAAMDRLYSGMLRFVRIPAEDALVYQADNACVRFGLSEAMIHRDCYRSLQVEVPSLAEIEKKLAEGQMEFTRHRGLVPGSETLSLLDPSGNWLEISETRSVR